MMPQPPPNHPVGRSAGAAWGCLTLFTVFCLLGLAWCHYTPLNRFPKEVLTALQQDSEAILYSLDHLFDSASMSARPGFHGNAILGQTRLEDAKDRRAMAAMLETATHGAWDYSGCFYPRHGFRVHGPSGVYDLAVCFECGRALIRFPEGRTKYVNIVGKPNFLNAYVRARFIPLSDSDSSISPP